VAKTANIVPKVPYDRNLLETFISNQQMLLAGQQRLEQRLNALEAQLCSPTKRKDKEEPEPFFTEKQLMEQIQLTRQTLFNYRRDGLLTFTKRGRTIRYSQTDIDNLKQRIK